jgi:arylsulfatase A-like enzyme
MPQPRNTDRPNIIFIVADDLGSADLGCYGGSSVSPNLDRLASEGLRFTRGYSNSPVCSPARFAMITGRWQYRLRGAAEEPLGGRRSTTLGLPPEHPTLPSLLRKGGYSTALVGKWHLGSAPAFGPLLSGYEEFFGPMGGGVDYFSHVGLSGVRDLWEGDRESAEQGYLTDLITRRAVEYVQRKRDRPFFLSVHYTAPHWPWETRDDAEESQRIGANIAHLDGGSVETYLRMISHMDEGIGKIVAAIPEAQYDNTLVVFVSDNGGERFSNNWPFIGGKMDALEGGIRIPQIAWWPRGIAAGSNSALPTLTMDWMPTMLEIAGVQPDPDYPPDGMSLLPLFADNGWNPPAICIGG